MPGASSPDPLLDLLGEPVVSADLALGRAQRLARFLEERDDVGAHLVEARRRDGWEWLLLSVDVDVGQAPIADIRPEEPIAVGFTPEDNAWPQTLALRADFPDNVSHQFLRVDDAEPVTLCLSEEPWQEARLRWSPGAFIRLLRTWLIDTGCDVLHRTDQALEPFIAAGSRRVILPLDLFDPERIGAPLFGVRLGEEDVGAPLYSFSFAAEHPQGLAAVAGILVSPPKIHGALRRAPRTLAEVVSLFSGEDAQFGETLDALVRAWLKQPNLREATPLLLVQVPMLRHEGGEPERYDLWPLLVDASVVELGVALDLWTQEGGGGEILFNRKPGPYGDAIAIMAANLLYGLSAAHAADFNGLAAPSGKSIVAVGAGALGSQVIANLARLGETVATIVDEDRLLPHNLARHAVWDRDLLGWAKARAMAMMLARLRNDTPSPTALVIDVTDGQADQADQLAEAIRSADAILDMAASIAVSRRLAIDHADGGRRIAAFLSPSGLDLVILAEDGARECRLDHLEMSLYAALLGNPDLVGHFTLPPERRYARGCREVSARLPQTAVALHAAVAAEQVRRIVDDDNAAAGVWRLNRETMTMRHVPLDVRPMLSFDAGNWSILIGPELLEAIRARRVAKLPAETGGVLLGTFDADRRIIYVVADIPAPGDSVETPVSFVRGAFGTAEAIHAAEAATLSMLRYVGEWHSHPDGSPALPSADDTVLFGYLVEGMVVEGHPPVMIIVGRDEVGVVTGT